MEDCRYRRRGSGQEAVSEGLHVPEAEAEAVAKRRASDPRVNEFDIASCDYHEKHDAMMRTGWRDRISAHNAIFFGAVGDGSR